VLGGSTRPRSIFAIRCLGVEERDKGRSCEYARARHYSGRFAHKTVREPRMWLTPDFAHAPGRFAALDIFRAGRTLPLELDYTLNDAEDEGDDMSVDTEDDASEDVDMDSVDAKDDASSVEPDSEDD